MKIGERIKQRRIELGLSQDELAQKLGYKSRSSINKIELNGQDLPADKIYAIAIALETTPAFIMGWEAAPRKEIRLTHLQKELLRKYEQLSKAHQQQIMDQIDFFLWQDNTAAEKDAENFG